MRKYLIASILLLLSGSLFAQSEAHFQKTEDCVYDYSGILTAEQFNTLNQRILAFDDSTSNQIAVIFTPTLYGEEIKDLGTRIGQAWGVGQKDLDNGVMIIIKTKTAEEPDGDVAILPGDGLEGVLPDAFCAKIIDDTMLNSLIDGDYYQAVVNALDIIEPVCRGEYSYEQYKEDSGDDTTTGERIIAILFWGFIIWYILRRLGKGGKHGSGGGYSSGSYHSGSSSHSSWSSSSSGHSFGGGSFGGGGASRKF